MTEHLARIDSYFSLATDLAEGMRSWPEFVRGQGYAVELKSQTERVSISLKDAADGDATHVLVKGEGTGLLFERALGCAVYAMSAHSDWVSVSRGSGDEV